MRSSRFPETAAGGFSRVDGTIEFYMRVQALLASLPPGAVVVDLGAGRGAASEDPVPFRRSLRDLRRPGRTVVGVDVDPAVLTNPLVDRRELIVPGQPLPLDTASVGAVVSDFTFEHVESPHAVTDELHRVLRPGAWVCARTPNKWGYIGLGARIVPNRLHVRALKRLQPDKPEVDTFPTAYRMNTRTDLQGLFPASRWHLIAYTSDAEPDLYAGGSEVLERALALAHRLPPPLKSMWNVFARKKVR